MLKNNQENIANAVIDLLPDKKLCGGYNTSWYTYPNLKVDINSRNYYHWANFDGNILSSPYDNTEVSDFRWVDDFDDEL